MTTIAPPPRLPRVTYLGFLLPLFVPVVWMTVGWVQATVLAVQLTVLAVQLVAFARYRRAYRAWRRDLYTPPR